MQQVSLYEAKTRLSELVDDAAKGSSFVISKHGRPMVMVSPIGKDYNPQPKRVGFLKDKFADFKLPEDFNTMMRDEISELFYGGEK